MIKNAGDQSRTKSDLLMRLNDLDKALETRVLSAEEWNSRYEIEEQLEIIYQMEEVHWQQMGSENWVLKGDSNTKFFQCMPMVGEGKTSLELWRVTKES